MGTADAEIEVPSVEHSELSKGYNIALHAEPPARNFFLIFIFPLHSTLFVPKSLSTFHEKRDKEKANVQTKIGVGTWLSWLEHRIVTPLTQVRFPGAARDFSPRVKLQCTLLRVSVHPRVQSHAFTSVRTLKIL